MFTKEQEKIIHSEDQHINVIANAGCGKSTVIVERVANLVLNKDVSPERIYLTSFSRVANKELQEKIFKRIGYEGNKITIKTIHGFCYQVIINNLDWFGYSKLDIIDVYRYERLVKSVMYQLDMINEETKESEILEYAVMFNKIKLNMNTDSLKGDMKHFFNEVEKLKKEQEKMTYEDLLVNTYVILSENEKVRDEYQSYYDHIIIDEGQDTDKLQFMIIELLLNVKTNTVIVGDAKQNIYGFRGASYKHSDDFVGKLNSVIYPLSETFRFGQLISDVSNKIMKHMDIKEDYKIPTVTNVDIKNEPSFNICSYTTCIINICDDIEEKIRQGYKYKDLHVLYRINRLSNEIQKELSRRRIPYIVQKGSFVNRKEIKFLMNIVQLYFSFDKGLFIEFIQSYSNGIDKKSVEKIYKEVEDKSNIFSFLDIAISKDIDGIGRLKKKIFGRISDYFLELDKIINSEDFKKSSLFIDIANIFEIENTKFMINVKSNTGESMIDERWEFITDFQSIYTQYDGSLKDFNNYLKVMFLNDASDGKEKDAVCLKTIHGSKGQTCPVTYLLGYKIADPYFTTSESDVLSELFLLYVGVTRARDYLYFYHDSLDDFLLSFIFPDKEEDYNSNLGKILDNSSENLDITKERKEDNNTPVDDYEKAQLSRNIKKDYEPLHENFIPVRTTPKAILFQDKIKFLSVWLPKSQMGYHENVYYCAGWLMKKNNLY